MFRTLCLLLCLSFFSLSASSDPLTRNEVPAPLEPWIDWVLQGENHKTCPFIYNNAKQHRCAWPASLKLSLYPRSGDFSVNWHIYQKSWITLPGDQKHWPENVTDNGVPTTVIRRNGLPSIQLAPGEHQINADFEWDTLPDSLSIPEDTGLISLNVNHRHIEFPDLKGNRLWVKKRQTSSTNQQGEQVNVEVFRQVIDEIPMQVLTKIELQVSGKQREVIIGKPMLADSIPLQLSSPLPARLEPDGSLRVQLRPGRWTIDIRSRFPTEMTSLAMLKQEKPWPVAEIWAFDSRNNLRLVEVEGAPSIDPRQTQMPDAWHQLPAYRLTSDEALNLKIIRRGDPEPEPDALSLNRNLWLDQSGKGFTITDTINGRMTQGWRLEASDTLKLGRVTLDDKPQFITQSNNKEGVEVRRGSVKLNADSRYEGDVTNFNAVGWDHDFQNVSATLHLPPGWKLFSASGVDTVPNTWLQRWTLLDLFLVLITTLAISNLWNWKTGLLSLITLVLLWHEPGAPRMIWLNIIAAIALLRALPEGKFRLLVSTYRNLALLALVLMSIPFMIDEVRIGLYPQVERPWQSVNSHFDRGNFEKDSFNDHSLSQVSIEAADTVYESEESLSSAPLRKGSSRSKRMLESRYSSEVVATSNQSKFPVRYDAKTNVQTGPGLPYWEWKKMPLNWNGPVEKEQQVDLVLLSPKINLFLNILRVFLLIGLAYFIIRTGKNGRGLNLNFKAHKATAALILLPFLFVVAPQDSQAELPSEQMLEELKNRLLAAPDCLPECAHASKMNLELTPQKVMIKLEVHSVDDVIIPLPNMGGKWAITTMEIDNEVPKDIFKSKNGQLWAHLSRGIHQINLTALLPELNSIDLVLPLKPARVSVASQGWDIAGVHEDGVPEQQLKLTRVQDKSDSATQTLEATTLPPFVQVHRTLRLGLDWRIETRLVRTSPSDAAIVIKLPLLEGESVLTDGFRIKNKHVLINMSANTSSVQWESSLKATDTINLTAPETTEWTEYWYADISPIWHIETEGIAVVHHQNPDGRWLPEWRPWSGESVRLHITRPEGVEGQTLTIDNSQISVSPGERATDVEMKISVRSSQGGQHTIKIPTLARLQSVSINGRSQPIRQGGENDREVTLPINPGKQNVHLKWRQPEGITSLHTTPAIDLGVPSVNSMIKLNLGDDRWVLFAGGPQWGPAVLFWGILAIILLVAIALGQVKLTPLSTLQWLLLSIGLSQAPIFSAVLVVGWLLALAARQKMELTLTKTKFNTMQVGLVILTLLALSTLFTAIQQGLLGSPDMQISGNGSSASVLNWYQDRVENLTPQAWIISAPLWIYRVLMLLWSLWLAFALLKWLRWGWECFSQGGLWQSFKFRSDKKAKKVSPEKAPE